MVRIARPGRVAFALVHVALDKGPRWVGRHREQRKVVFVQVVTAEEGVVDVNHVGMHVAAREKGLHRPWQVGVHRVPVDFELIVCAQ